MIVSLSLCDCDLLSDRHPYPIALTRERIELREICTKRDREDKRALEENRQEVFDNNARTLIVWLSGSTARGPSREK